MQNRPSFKKYSLGLVLAVFSFITIFGSMAFAQPAQAAFPVTVIADMPEMVTKLATQVKDGFKTAVMMAAQRAVSYMLRKMAHDSAVWLASGGKGQSPLAYTSDIGSYMENVLGDAFGEAIGELGRPFGLDLCKVPDVKIDLAIKIGLRDRSGGDQGVAKATPACNWNSFVKGWSKDAWTSKYGSSAALQQQFNASLTADSESDFGIYLSSVNKIDNIVSKKAEAALARRAEGQGFKGLTSLISGDVKTPAQVTAEQFKDSTPDKEGNRSQAQIQAAISSGNAQIIPSTLSMFLNTLSSQMLKNFQKNGMLPFGVCVGEYGGEHCKNKGQGEGVATFEGAGVKIGGRAAAQAAFSEFLVANIKAQDNYDILAQLENCPDAPGKYNCRIDGDLVQGVQAAKYDKPLTIAEAMKQGFIHPEWKLLGPERAENLDVNCKDNAYCYANIKVLRQTRILPLGFEIAALNSPPDTPWKVEDVVKGFNDCSPNGDYDSDNYPFCHLIDPNWVLRVEPTRCNALVNGAQPLMSDAPDRLEDCADLSSCVAYNKDGTCLSYGYCAREKNVWRFEADKCDAQFNTCKAFTDSNGDSAAYLYRTLDTTYCNQNTAGCLAFSLNQDNNGNWLDPNVNNDSQYFNNGIHFNNKISSSCGSNSMGCSAFKVAVSPQDEPAYLRKAPDYLKCYDATPMTASIDWPKNNADLARMQPKADCSLYAQVCTALEVDCNMFTSLLTGEQIPGKFKPAEYDNPQSENRILTAWNDQCDKKCDGYAAYREMPNNYSNGRSVAYIIPSSGSTCRAEDEGCASFTNMNEVSAGGEKLEYYSKLRPCIKPDANKQKNFYTYEGVEGGTGYQLKVYTLEKDVDGGPKYWFKTAADLTAYNNSCTETRYKAGLASADCRQFNDDAGKVYYRLLEQTIVVNNSCTYYRLNSSELATSDPVPTCFQNGEYKDGFCYYNGLPSGIQTTAGASRSCSASVESCFAYKGNAANNVKEIFKDDFEGRQTPATTGWSADSGALTISTESTHFGEHSLGYVGNGNLTKNIGEIKVGDSYVLTFWAKGNKKDVNINLVAGTQQNSVGTLNASDVWQYYSFSPTEVVGGTSIVQLVLSGGSGINLFLDNVRLVRIDQLLYRVRNTLKVDGVCDSNLNDNFPGEALGCTGYTAQNANEPYYLTNFSYLCRNGAVGCTAFLDTYNTINNEKAEAYNVWLEKKDANPLTTSLELNSGQKLTKIIGSDSYSCQVPVGETGCYVDVLGHAKDEITATPSIQQGVSSYVSASFKASTVYIPADTPASAPIYLVNVAKSICNPVDLGCTFAGAQTINTSTKTYSTVTIKNDPALYKENLCQSEAVGCSAYSLGEGSYYFKDPKVTGQRICEYKNNTLVDGTPSSGWFWKGTNDPCYPDYLQAGNNYGLWSFGDKAKYQNFVGECPTTQSGCTEYVDNNDKKTGAEKGQAYYFINNDKINSGDCDGLVSQKDGCILFDQTDKPGKLWDTKESYKLIASKNSVKVAPVNNTAVKDANTIIKVIRDRECGEWLQCRDIQNVWDESNSKWKQVCSSQLGRCNMAPTTNQEGGRDSCANYVDAPVGKVLTQDLYSRRDTSWQGADYSGYSLLGMYQPDELVQFNIASSTEPEDWRLVKFITCGTGGNCAPANQATSVSSCKQGVANDAVCGRSSDGRCYNGFCIQNHLGTTDFVGSGTNATQNKLKATCRAYPEKTSPFPNYDTIKKSSLFSGVNTCDEGEVGGIEKVFSLSDKDALNCECNYTKATYGDNGVVKYYDYYSPNGLDSAPSGICEGGDNAGSECNGGAQCVNGTCQLKKREDKLLGWQGYCLEQDFSRNVYSSSKSFACLTWLPVGSLSGYPDINNQHTEAGFVPNTNGANGEYYCLAARGNRGDATDGAKPYEEKVVTGQELYHKGGESDRFKRISELANTNIYKDEIDYIRFSITKGSGNWFPEGNYYIRHGLVTKLSGTLNVGRNAWEVVSVDNGVEKVIASYDGVGEKPKNIVFSDERSEMGEQKKQVYSNGIDRVDNLGIGKTLWSLAYDDGEDDGEGDSNGYNFALPSATKYRDLLSNGEKPGCDLSKDDYDNFQGCTEDHDDEDDGCAFGVYFDANDQLNKIIFTCHTGDYRDDEGVFINGSLHSPAVKIDVYVGLREPCIKVADVKVDNSITAVANTQNLWQGSNFLLLSDAKLGYAYKFPKVAPFGSLGASWDTSKLISVFSHFDNYYKTEDDGVSSLENILPKSSIGAPYSCGSFGKCFGFDDAGDADITKSGTASLRSLTEAKTTFSQLFSAYKIWDWTLATSKTNKKYEVKSEIVNTTEIKNGIDSAPVVHAVGECDAGGNCIEISSAPGMTINGAYDADVVINNLPARATLKFFASANEDQMPLRKVSVNWGEKNNPQPITYDGYFRNQKGYFNGNCNSDGYCVSSVEGGGSKNLDRKCATNSDCAFMPRCVDEDDSYYFGSILNKTCDSRYFQFEHVYQCSGPTSENWDPECNGNDAMKARYKGCCVFKPKVQVKDNWGWCNGVCKYNGVGDDVGGDGCYGGDVNKSNECKEMNTNGSYTEFQKNVLVAPR